MPPARRSQRLELGVDQSRDPVVGTPAVLSACSVFEKGCWFARDSGVRRLVAALLAGRLVGQPPKLLQVDAISNSTATSRLGKAATSRRTPGLLVGLMPQRLARPGARMGVAFHHHGSVDNDIGKACGVMVG